jgi:hypothetical protein
MNSELRPPFTSVRYESSLWHVLHSLLSHLSLISFFISDIPLRYL